MSAAANAGQVTPPGGQAYSVPSGTLSSHLSPDQSQRTRSTMVRSPDDPGIAGSQRRDNHGDLCPCVEPRRARRAERSRFPGKSRCPRGW